MTEPLPERLPPLASDRCSDERRRAIEDFEAARKAPLGGPWSVLLRSPELMTQASRMGEYLRFRSPFAGRLCDLVVLLVARAWTQDYEFAVHAASGAAAGLAPELIEAIRQGRRPETGQADERLVIDFVTELLDRRSVSDATWNQALARFGEAGCVDLCGLVGYYGFLAGVMNAARTGPPRGAELLPRFPA